ncbi:ATP-dependent DNA helicase [Sergentomyia squamirostris]
MSSTNIDEISKQIREIDAEIYRLKRKKQELEMKKEKLKGEKFAEKSRELAQKNWTGDFSWTLDIYTHLRDTFHLQRFKEHQIKAVNAILSKHDVILVAPTGGGKSLCYQLPAVVSSGLTLVVSPLVSLMEDQVWSLKKLDIDAELLCSTSDKDVQKNIYKQLGDAGKDGKCLQVLYVTPERMAKSKRFMSALQKCYFAKKVDRIAIDEVHCCSQWGHDFRPDYKFLGSLKTTFPDVPILGVTATATEKVIMDVQKMLNIRDCLVLKAPFNRPNLYYHVMEKPSEKVAVVDLIANLIKRRYAHMTGIIYTLSQKDAEDLAANLINRNCKVRPYHANLEPKVRSTIHASWLRGEIQVVVATVAFGMGIDKPDVRFVIHHTISKSMENFYQETGRAGRDGNPAECLLLYRFTDMFKITTMLFAETMGLPNAYDMIRYCIDSSVCRRDLISQHFAEVWNEGDCKQMCDHCRLKDRARGTKVDISKHLKDLLEILTKAEQCEEKLTGNKLIEVWYQRGPSLSKVNKLSPPSFSRSYAEMIIAHLILEEYLREDFHYTAYSTNSYIRKGQREYTAGDVIDISKIRFLDLPEKFPPVVEQSDDEVQFVRQTPSKRHSHNDSQTSGGKKKKSSHRKMHRSPPAIKCESESSDDLEIVSEQPRTFVALD